MKLICFPHYTCGGLLCDILNDTFSTVGKNGGINNVNHSLGKIGDSNSVFDDYNIDDLVTTIKKIKTDKWIATHCWPGILPLHEFDQIINITTTTYKSKLYRWIRAYYHYYYKSVPWTSILDKQERIDKERETAKNYLLPFKNVTADNIINLEFSEVVECQLSFVNLVGTKHVKHTNRWREYNSFLYSPTILFDPPAKRFYEAEVECNLKQQYIYE